MYSSYEQPFLNIHDDMDAYQNEFQCTRISRAPFSFLNEKEYVDELIKTTLAQNLETQHSIKQLLEFHRSRLENYQKLYEENQENRKKKYKNKFFIKSINFSKYDNNRDRIPTQLFVIKLSRHVNKKKVQQQKVTNFTRILWQDSDYDNSSSSEDEKEFISNYKQKRTLLQNGQDSRFNKMVGGYLESQKQKIETAQLKLYQINWIKMAKNFNCLYNDRKEFIQQSGLELYTKYMNKFGYFKERNLKAWTPEQDRVLLQAVETHGKLKKRYSCTLMPRWSEINNYFDGKTPCELYVRFNKKINPSILKGKWCVQEDLKILVLFEMNFKFHQMYKTLNSRTDVQIRERFCNVLDPTVNYKGWSREDQRRLQEIVQSQMGTRVKWNQIAKEVYHTHQAQFQGRTDNQCYRQWKQLSLQQKDTNQDNDSNQVTQSTVQNEDRPIKKLRRDKPIRIKQQLEFTA